MGLNHFRKVRQLYKVILKMHNGLPEHIKTIGNACVKEEFKKHKNCKPFESAVFLEEWTKYAVVLAQQLGVKGLKTGQKLGKPLTLDEIDSMSNDQIQKMYEIMLATQGKISDNNTSDKKLVESESK